MKSQSGLKWDIWTDEHDFGILLFVVLSIT
jgi:hypothetical protein